MRVRGRGAIASPHHLASAAGQTVLASGGNAVDAAVATNLVLAVVTPYHCGAGGDLVAIVWDGASHGVHSIGAAPAGATAAAVAAAVDAGHGDPTKSLATTAGMPAFGALPVTVPGAVAGWFHLLEHWGSKTFGELATTAIGYANDGFTPSDPAAEQVEMGRRRVGDQPGWAATYGRMRAGERFVQHDLARTLQSLAVDGPDALYRGPIGTRVVDTLRKHGSTMTVGDLAEHRITRVEPLHGSFREVEVLELPPPTQGVTALTALGVLDGRGARPADPALATHLQVEAVRAALADRHTYLADPASMRVTARALLDPGRLAAMAADLDPDRAASWPPARPAPGGTAYICAADDDGLVVSVSQSNFVGFGSGVVVDGTGIGLHNRGAHFSLDPSDPNVIGPRKLPMHTLIPALALRDGHPWLVFGTMGGDGQPQTHVQVLGNRLELGMDVQDAVAAPRWVVDAGDGSVAIERRADPAIVAGLVARGHRVRELAAYDHLAGHAHAIEVTPSGYQAASDPRCEGAAVGR